MSVLVECQVKEKEFPLMIGILITSRPFSIDESVVSFLISPLLGEPPLSTATSARYGRRMGATDTRDGPISEAHPVLD